MATETAIQTTPPQDLTTTNDSPRSTSWTYRPNVDIFDTPEGLLLMVDLPGTTSDSIDVSMESGILTLQADVEPRHNGAGRCTTHEYGIGGFHRRFEIDDAIDADAVTAEYRNGSLTIRLPRSQKSLRRRIEVTS